MTISEKSIKNVKNNGGRLVPALGNKVFESEMHLMVESVTKRSNIDNFVELVAQVPELPKKRLFTAREMFISNFHGFFRGFSEDGHGMKLSLEK